MGSRRSPSRRRRLRVAGLLLVFCGIALLGSGTGYFIYGFKAHAGLGRLNYAGGTFQVCEDAPPAGSLPPAIHILIPAIDVDSPVEELSINDLGDSRSYDTPKHLVGHIPETANAGEKGTAWFFGHLESPIKGEGSVFHDLPRIPEMLYNEEEVYVILKSDEGGFLYRLTSSEVLAEDDLRLHDTGEPTIRLVTCVPPLYYDYRLIIWGELVGVDGG
jgi:sortase (surface protein transpeptidase)